MCFWPDKRNGSVAFTSVGLWHRLVFQNGTLADLFVPIWVYMESCILGIFLCFNCSSTAIYHCFSCSWLYSHCWWKEHMLCLYECRTWIESLENNMCSRKAGIYMNAHLRNSQIHEFSYPAIDCYSLLSYWTWVKHPRGRTERLLHKMCSNWWGLWKVSRKGCMNTGEGKREA